MAREKKTPKWYQEAIMYELHIRAFFDGNHDGSGDFQGLTQKLDYLQELGVTAVWLLPFYPSPLKDDGYDIADYTSVHHAYGNLDDFKRFLQEAHRRHIRVITELVLNHTSDQHPWFQRARHDQPGGQWRNYYVWSDTSEKYPEARIIFKDFETSNWAWDEIAQAYYWHRFYSHQPDLNYDHPAVQVAVLEWVDFWLNLGVDGLRLDAIPYLFERDGTNGENLPETHQFLKKLRRHIDEKFPDRMLLAEANQWPEEAVAYFGNADECHMAFHFPLMPRLFMALHQEERSPLVDIIERTPALPETCQWAIFLRNHDELTLEMVTEEEREQMYQAYAPDPQARINLGIRRRLAPLLHNDHRKIKLLNGLLFAFPGTPVIYYGDEIGMGDNISLSDRNGVRTPMQWNSELNAGFSEARKDQLFLPVNEEAEYHYLTINVAAQQNNPDSLLSWMKKLIALRQRHRSFSLGALQFLSPENKKILAFMVQYEDEKILVLANFSSLSQTVKLDLSAWRGANLLDLWGGNTFSVITESPCFFTFAPYDFFWLLLNQSEKFVPSIEHSTGWAKKILENIHRLDTQRWFNKKYSLIQSAEIIENIPLFAEGRTYCLFLVKLTSPDGESDIYFLPVTQINDAQAESLQKKFSQALLVQMPEQNSWLIDACYDSDFNRVLLDAIACQQKFAGQQGFLKLKQAKKFNSFYNKKKEASQIKPLEIEQSNTSVIFDNQLILKYYRRCQQGDSLELEKSQFLTEKSSFSHTPALIGFLEYTRQDDRYTLGVLQQYLPHQTDAWQYSLNHLSMLSSVDIQGQPLPQRGHWWENIFIPAQIQTLFNTYGSSLHLLGQRTGQMHIALSDLARESFSPIFQNDLSHAIHTSYKRTAVQLQQASQRLPAGALTDCQAVLNSSALIEACLDRLLSPPLDGMRIPIHGDFHLGQALYTGEDFFIIDFEGEPEHALAVRRMLHSPLRDIAGMLRSFDYASQIVADRCSLSHAQTTFWRQWMSAYFLQGYFSETKGQAFLPDSIEEGMRLLQVLLIEKALYEIQYELSHRPDWVAIPCRRLISYLGGGDGHDFSL
jgi:maltose alpha-D-glucosyltransferase / alpha-amylase